MSRTQNKLLLPQLELAESFWARGIGLLGRSSLETTQALWLKPCNNIHTFFMKFPIDCVFLDRKMTIKFLYSNIPPWRVIWPHWSSSSVIEMSKGNIERLGLQIGEELYVDS